MVEQISPKNLLIGFTKVGKSTFLNFINGVNLEIVYNKYLKRYSISAENSKSGIGNQVESCTTESIIIEDFCDLPGITSTDNSRDNQAKECFTIYNALSKCKNVRLILLIEIDLLYTSNSSNFVIFLNQVKNLYSLTEDLLSCVHLILTKADKDEEFDLIEFLRYTCQKSENIIIKGVINGDVTWDVFYKPRQNQNEYNFDGEMRQKILFNIEKRGFFKNEVFNMEFLESKLYEYAREKPKFGEAAEFWNTIGRSKNLEEYKGEVYAKQILFIDKDVKIDRTDSLRIECKLLIVRDNEHSKRNKLELLESFKVEFDDNMIIVHPEKAFIQIGNDIENADFWEHATVSVNIEFKIPDLNEPITAIIFWKDISKNQLPDFFDKKNYVYVILSYEKNEGHLDENKLLYEIRSKIGESNPNYLIFFDKAEFRLIYENFKGKRDKKVISTCIKFNDSIVFTSNLPKKINCESCYIKAQSLLVIDRDIEFDASYIDIKSPCIVVIPKNKGKCIRFDIIGDELSKIKFSENIKRFIDDKNLYIKFVEKNIKHSRYFPEDFQNFCSKDYHYLRLEHILVNSFFKEYVSMNNKYIELLVYWQKNFGVVLNANKWNININDMIIYSRFYIRECMNFKSSIKDNYKAVKDFEDIAKYLTSMQIQYNENIVADIEEVFYHVPSIFHMLVIPEYYNFNKNCQVLNEIKKMIVKRYVEFINSLHKKGIVIKQKYMEKYTKFLEKCHACDSRNQAKKIFDYLNNPVNNIYSLFNDDCKDFLVIYENLSKSPDGRNYLLSNNLSGDQTAYYNWTIKAGAKVLTGIGINSARIIVKELVKKGVRKAIEKIFTAGVTEAVKQTAKATVINTIKQAAKFSVKGVNNLVSIGITASLFGVELAANIASAKYYTGFKGEIVYLVND